MCVCMCTFYVASPNNCRVPALVVVGETGLVPILMERTVLDSVHSILRSCVLRQCGPVKRDRMAQ